MSTNDSNSRDSFPDSGPGMNAPGEKLPAGGLRVLHLEDDRIQAEMVRQLLAKEFPGSRLTVVSSRFAFLGELQRQKFDLIVSDFSLESFNGLEALDLAKERVPNLPFVFYSGTIGEDRAAQALQHGALDYVPKGQIQRLGGALHRIVDDTGAREQRNRDEQVRRAQAASLEAVREVGRQIGEQTERLQRLENMGLLVAGAAHDLNNMLSPMLMAVPILRDSIPGAPGRRILDTLEKSTRRAASLVAQILAFAHQGTPESRVQTFERILRDVCRFITESFPPNVKINQAIRSPLWPVQAISGEVCQALLNLSVNAREAMPDGGTLTVGAENCVLSAEVARTIRHARPGRFVVLRVDDTGTGISPETVDRMWDPAEKPQPEGEGAPLGLPTVRNILNRHSGFADVQTVIGFGTSVRLYFPEATV
ncbi:MAG: hybrid sensor histidine kinase/response regulator [Verrucomicrobia bacterium]|nr:hybrid sensor histidine kinase/response regulator [Verrucomicrobiota bacterium]